MIWLKCESFSAAKSTLDGEDCAGGEHLECIERLKTFDLFLEDFGFRIWIKPWQLILSLLNNNHTRKESSDADTFLLVSHTKALEREKENQLFRHQFLIIDPFLLGILILFNYESTSSILTLLDMGGLPEPSPPWKVLKMLNCDVVMTSKMSRNIF